MLGGNQAGSDSCGPGGGLAGPEEAELGGVERRFWRGVCGEALHGPICTLVSSQEAPPVPGFVIQAYLPLEKSTSDVEGFFPTALKGREEAGQQGEGLPAGWEVVILWGTQGHSQAGRSPPALTCLYTF